MSSTRLTHVFASLATVLTAAAIAQTAEPVAGTVKEVTLYRGQARVTRAVPVEGVAGRLEIVVGDLPEQTVPNSLFAEGNGNVEVHAVRFRTRAVGEEPREEVRAIDVEIRDAQRQLELVQKRQTLLGKRAEYLGKLEGFVAPTAQTDLARGVLDAEALEQITTFTFAQYETIAQEEVELAKQGQELSEQIELLNRQRAEITAGASQTVREAVLFVEKRDDGPAEARLNYLVNNCGWSPTYVIRAGDDRKHISVEYNALIHQLTGEDWSSVVLTLSTASPTLSAAGPGLAPLYVTLAADVTGQVQSAEQQGAPAFYGRGLAKAQVADELAGLMQKKGDLNRAMGSAMSFADNYTTSWDLNLYGCQLQQLELNADTVAMSVLNSERFDEQEGPSLTYKLGGNVDLASRADQQIVRIVQKDLESDFYHVAVPLLSSYVYREAQLINSSDEDLLGGPMTAYLDGKFVGQGEIPTVACGEKFVVGFGANPQLRTGRKLVDKVARQRGANMETLFDYRLAIESFSDEATVIRVFDRLPQPEPGTDIRVTMGESSDKISEDKLYQREERPTGILRWDVEVPPSASGEDARMITYKYSVEYDKQYVLSPTSAKPAVQEEFERLQRERLKR